MSSISPPLNPRRLRAPGVSFCRSVRLIVDAHRGTDPRRAAKRDRPRAAQGHRGARHGPLDRAGRGRAACTCASRSPRPAARSARTSRTPWHSTWALSTGVTAVTVDFDVLSDSEKQTLQQRLGRGALPQGALARVKNVICVGSGKGGVGKSTVTANLAGRAAGGGHERRRHGRRRVGLLDPAHARRARPPVGHRRAQDRAARRRRRREGDLDRVLPRHARTRPSPGAARCCTRRSASSWRTWTGASSTTC